MTPIERRVQAAQATLDRFGGKRLDWRRYDCIRMCAFAAQRLGHAVPLSRFGKWRDEASARKALEANGFPTLVEAVDSLGFAPMAYACGLPGDIFCLANDSDQEWQLGSLGVFLDNGRALGFLGGVCQPVQPLLRKGVVLAAWRVNPHA